MVYNLTICRVAEVVSYIVASIAVYILKLQVLHRLDYLLALFVTVRSRVRLSSCHELVTTPKVLLSEFIFCQLNLLDLNLLHDFGLIYLQPDRSALFLQILIKRRHLISMAAKVDSDLICSNNT